VSVSVPKAPETITTSRLLLRRPAAGDAEAVFARYACDPEVTRWVAWPTHRSSAQTREFLAWSDGEWASWPAGPYLVCARDDGSLLGSTGLAFETRQRAATGYVLARDVWGRGYATEALSAMAALADSLAVERLYALCHVDHRASARVLEKAGFEREGVLRRHTVFPNLGAAEPCDVLCYARTLGRCPENVAFSSPRMGRSALSPSAPRGGGGAPPLPAAIPGRPRNDC
jgi:RimJ/RimL family protein N-acetyltransferase